MGFGVVVRAVGEGFGTGAWHWIGGEGGAGERTASSVVRDGEAAEDGEAAVGVEAGGLGAAQAAPGAALVALLVRQRVRGAGRTLVQLR